MTPFVLDTDILSLYWEGHDVLCRHVAGHSSTDLAITAITVEEQLSGWYSLLRQAKQPPALAHAYRRLADAVYFLARWPILPFSESAIARYETLKALKLNVAKMDLRIAAIVLENAGVLVTRNLRDFQRIPHLPLEDWTV
jgi:tRNA(fMet)-specific endonuclease VapC